MRHSARLEAKLADKMNQEPSDNVHTPPLMSPPGTRTPPSDPSKRAQMSAPAIQGTQRQDSEQLDADALSKALHQFEEAGRTRERTPGESPKRKRQRIYGDRLVVAESTSSEMLLFVGARGADSYNCRFIPNRSGQDLHASYNLLHEDGSPASPSRSHKKAASSELHVQKSK